MWRNLGLSIFLASDLSAAVTLPDPTQPPDHAPFLPPEVQEAVVDWRVSGITISHAARSAIVNGVVVVPGQSLGRATVVQILPGEVVLDQDGLRVTVKLLGPPVKRPVSN